MIAAYVAAMNCASAVGFTVEGSTLRDPCGEPIVLRGVNAGIAFPADPNATKLGEIAKTGANAVRLTFRWLFNRSDPAAVEIAIRSAVANRMLAMPSVWDATGNWPQLQFAADFWSQPAMVSVLRKYEDMVLLNIANEAGNWQVSGEQYRSGYARAIRQLRNAGLHMPLVIDAANWGRRESDLLEHGKYLLAEDPDHNLLFSWHPWDGAQPKARYVQAMDAASKAGLALIIGEFAQVGVDSKTPLDYRGLIRSASERDIGWLWWWWASGEPVDTHAMTTDGKFGHWANAGEEIALTSPYGIQASARRTAYLRNRECGAGQGAKPVAPDHVSAEAIQGAEVRLAWQDDAGDAKNFDIEVWDELRSGWRLVKVVGPNIRSTTVGADLAFVYSMDPIGNPSLAYERTYRFRVGAYRSRDAIAHSGPVTVSTGKDPRSCAGGNGLTGEYFYAGHHSQDFAEYDGPAMVRTDPKIQFDWGAGSPSPGRIGNDQFQIRWSGYVMPQFSGSYAFYANSDDFARVWVDGKPLIDNWQALAKGWMQGRIDLVAGRKYPLRVEYREWDGNASIELQWATGKLQREAVPQCRLFTRPAS